MAADPTRATLGSMSVNFPPTPGLDGTYSDACVRCLQGTDAGVAFEGSAEWVVAGLVSLGISLDQAVAMLGWTDGSVPSGKINGADPCLRRMRGHSRHPGGPTGTRPAGRRPAIEPKPMANFPKQRPRREDEGHGHDRA